MAELLRQHAADYPSPQLLMPLVSGRAALGAGRLDTACALLGPVVEVLTASDETIGLQYRYQLPRTIALAMRGSTDEAAAALAALEKRRHPNWRYLDYERSLARAWVAAAQGAVTEAIPVVLSAAETARANGQFAAEVMCLQTATQFGDDSGAPVCVSSKRSSRGLASAWRPDSPPPCATATGLNWPRCQRISSAWAILLRRSMRPHTRPWRIAVRSLRGSALGCSTRAEALAEQCGGASTPALRQAGEPLPLTDREREIVMLIGQGLSTRAVAERLTLSVRTVEGHIYSAMTKTGTASRDELVNLLPRQTPRTQ